jgi:hypothetical protein
MRQAMTFEGGKGLTSPSKVSFIAGKMSEILGDEFIAKMDQARSTGAKRKKEIEPSADKKSKTNRAARIAKLEADIAQNKKDLAQAAADRVSEFAAEDFAQAAADKLQQQQDEASLVPAEPPLALLPPVEELSPPAEQLLALLPPAEEQKQAEPEEQPPEQPPFEFEVKELDTEISRALIEATTQKKARKPRAAPKNKKSASRSNSKALAKIANQFAHQTRAQIVAANRLSGGDESKLGQEPPRAVEVSTNSLVDYVPDPPPDESKKRRS